MLLGTSYRGGKQRFFIEDQISQELILPYIQWFLTIHLLIMTFQQQQDLEKYLKTGILI
jgi:hypothetical protein